MGGCISVDRIISKLDGYLDKNDYASAERHILYWLSEAESGQDFRTELLMRNELMGLYRKLGRAFSKNKNWSYYILTSHEGFEALYGRKADKKRKLYNGMIKCDVYQYFGEK